MAVAHWSKGRLPRWRTESPWTCLVTCLVKARTERHTAFRNGGRLPMRLAETPTRAWISALPLVLSLPGSELISTASKMDSRAFLPNELGIIRKSRGWMLSRDLQGPTSLQLPPSTGVFSFGKSMLTLRCGVLSLWLWTWTT